MRSDQSIQVECCLHGQPRKLVGANARGPSYHKVHCNHATANSSANGIDRYRAERRGYDS
jgi:hypothetical protein